MTWINPPEFVRRFTVHQIVQHWISIVLGGVLIVTAAASPFVTSGIPGEIHVVAGLAAAGFLVYHFFVLVGIEIREDVPVEKVAFIPYSRPVDGKYAPWEKGDYFLILLWSVLLAATGVVLRWPGRLGVPGPHAYFWLKILHAGCGAAWVVHLFSVHVPARWLRSERTFRKAVFVGVVPLEDVLSRPGWISDLVAAGVLVPVPTETVSEERLESQKVRDRLEEGNMHAREGRFEEAAACFEEAIRLYPEYSQARYNLGIVRMRQGKTDLAASQFRRFLEMDPFNPMAERAKEMLKDLASEGGRKG
jgi:hypothetical protein